MENSKVEYAGFWLRFVAYIIDYVVIQILQSFLIIPFLGILGLGFLIPASEMDSFDFEMMSDGDIMMMLGAFIGAVSTVILLAAILSILYFSIMESSKYQGTLGKMAIGLKVTDLEGNRVDFSKALIRQIGKIISGIILFIGYIMAGFTDKKQALHDIMANALVVKK